MRARTLIAYGVVLYSMAGTPAAAQCGGGFLGLQYFVTRSSVSALFSGTVTGVKQSAFKGTVTDFGRSDRFLVVTFEVARVWKGNLPNRLIAYRPAPVEMSGQGTAVNMHFKVGKRYVVVAHHLTAIERAEVGAEQNPDALMVEMCGGGSRPFELAAPMLSDELGTGRAPR
jgi:hypothetical protein